MKGNDNTNMSSIEKIGKTELIALCITIITNNIIINVPTIIIKFSGSGAWLNMIYLTFICLIFILFVCKLMKPFVNFDILDISEFLGGKVLKVIIGFLYIVLFLSFSGICLRYFVNSLHIIYFQEIPFVFLILLFITPIVIASRSGLKAISGTNLVLIPVAVISIIVLLFTASKDFTWQRLFPILGYSSRETFVTGITNIFAFNVISYLYFFKPFSKDESNFKKISIISVIICGIYLLVSVTSLLMSFSFIIETDETLSLYNLTRLVNFGRFFQRVDAIFIFLWILTVLSFLSLNVFIIAHIIKKSINTKVSSELIYPTSAMLFAVALSFKDVSVIKFINRNIYKIYNCILVFIISLLILLFAYFKSKKKQGDTK